MHTLRVLDDQEGGSAAAREFVGEHFATAKHYLLYANFSNRKVRHRLIGVFAQLQQLLGWMAYDAEEHDVARRHFWSALQAAQTVDDKSLTAHLFACMAYHSVHCGEMQEALECAEQARGAALKSPPAVRALVASRRALLSAAVSNEVELCCAGEEAMYFITEQDAMATRPSWLYWFDEKELRAQIGYAYLVLGRCMPGKNREMTARAETLLASHFDADLSLRPREVSFEGTWLARNQFWCRELEKAIASGLTVIKRLSVVRSPRSLTLLRKFTAELSQDRSLRGNIKVAEFLDEARLALGASEYIP